MPWLFAKAGTTQQMCSMLAGAPHAALHRMVTTVGYLRQQQVVPH
jgi:hypothetical protein